MVAFEEKIYFHDNKSSKINLNDVRLPTAILSTDSSIFSNIRPGRPPNYILLFSTDFSFATNCLYYHSTKSTNNSPSPDHRIVSLYLFALKFGTRKPQKSPKSNRTQSGIGFISIESLSSFFHLCDSGMMLINVVISNQPTKGHASIILDSIIFLVTSRKGIVLLRCVNILVLVVV